MMMPQDLGAQMVVGSATDVGRVRDHNEDALFVNPKHGLFIVSDGMGGQQAGALASEIVVKVLPPMLEERLGKLRRWSADIIRHVLSDAIMALSRELRARSADQAGLKGMGATVVLVLIRGRRAYIAHMGDSRAYLFRRGWLTPLTDDHSIVGILLRQGEISEAQARKHPARGRLSRYVGMEGEVYPDVRVEALRKADRLLLCTDGLTGMISDIQIKRILKANREPQKASQALVDAANRAGGKDNVTVVMVGFP
jgi:protein phosphatase